MKKLNFKKINIFILIFVGFYILPNLLIAQTLSLTSEKVDYNTGDSFLVMVKLDARGQPINTVSGTVIIPTDIFTVSNIEVGKSIISLWIDKPVYSQGEIHFSGGLPGGYNGSDGIIFSFILKAKSHGLAEINFKNISAYLNDGKGTPVSRLTLKALTFDISKDSTITSNYKSDIDITPPEKFDIMIAKDISIENNKYFVSFFAVDKGSGLARYEVEEKPLVISLFGYKKVWLDVKNLQVLEYQNWPSIIYVRAYDQAGNVTEENIYKFNNYIYYTLALLLFVLIIINIKKWYNEKVKAKI